MPAELPRMLHGAASTAVTDRDARLACTELKIIGANVFRRHAAHTKLIPSNGEDTETNLRLRTAGDLTSYLTLSLAEFDHEGDKSLAIDVVREFKDAEHFSSYQLEEMAVWEEGRELGSRPLCEYYYGVERPDNPYVWRTDWDFHHGRGLALDRARAYTPDEFCGLIVEDGGQQLKVGTREVCALGILLAGAYPCAPPRSGSASAA